jgi:hypothetical protein
MIGEIQGSIEAIDVDAGPCSERVLPLGCLRKDRLKAIRLPGVEFAL